ncbi:sigma factor-like helix-turn-helix DNA-binding protein [Rathayibacter sp. Leaf296]|uniref:sigma factor-like helix-turn-helix DNA-binding protein n=1 Tax=Rathayibacter sp. Leaf296 TaxID=1736327 RepID=UPI0007031417|nr:sigma factor-like helix-turn-helix DNA-binding protein [Rathayibacter sp. Leaf296]KQQ08459.1 hypothetical protein ASF46_14245 [Rathayibacter sp. Leaf296]
MATSPYEDFSFESDLPSAWSSAFPWLEGHATADRAELRAALTGREVGDPSARAAIVEHILEYRTSSTMRELFPAVRSRDVPHRVESVRLRNVLLREDIADFETLAPMRVRGVMVIRGMGARSVTDLLSWAVDEAIRTNTTSPADPTASAPLTRRSRQAAEATPRTRLLDAVQVAASWRQALGQGDVPLLSASRNPRAAPSVVVEAWAVLDALTPDQWIGAGSGIASLPEQLGVHLAELDDRQRMIFLERHVHDRRATLDQLGERLGVTRERVRQLEVRVGDATSGWLERDEGLAFRAAAVRSRIGVLSHVELLASVPGLLDAVDDVGTTALAVLDAVDDGFEGDGAWFAVPSLGGARSETEVRFADLADQHGGASHLDVLASFAEWTALSEKRVVEWMTALGHVRIGDVWARTRRASIGDLAVALLSVEGAPRSIEWIEAAFEGEREARSIRNALANDERLIRVGRGDWGLVEWGGEVYTSIKDAIAAEVERSDGAVALDALLEDLPDRLSVAASSVRGYASGWPFVTRAGVVRFAERRAAVRKKPGLSKNLYFLDDGRVAFRLEVTAEHLRGSGTVLSSGVALALGLAPGERKRWHGDDSGITVTWEGTQPQMGTIRAALATIDSARGDVVRLDFAEDRVTVSAVEDSGDVTALTGVVADDDGALAVAVGLDRSASASDVLIRLEERGESDLAALLRNRAAD